MNLSELDVNESAKIRQLNCSEELKQRFYSFGIIAGEIIIVEEISLAKQTMGIKVVETHIAIRLSEAKLILIERI